MGPSPPPRPPRLLRSPGWPDEVRAGLEELIASPGEPRPVAVLDWDETAIRGDISETLLALVAERTGAPLVEEYEEECRRDLLQGYVRLVDTLCAGRREADVRADARFALAEGGRRGRVAIREAVRELVWALHRHGWEVWVVTASAEVLVQAVAEQYGIHPHRVLGMRLAVGDDGAYVPGVLPPVTWREGKLDALRLAIGRDPTLMLGDSQGDLPLLRAARRRLVLDKGDERLREEARANGWWLAAGAELP